MPTRLPPRVLIAGAVLALVAGALFFHDLGRYPLWDPDEARHAEVAREMAAGHGIRRWFLPTLGLEPYREKPAAYYWLVTLAYGVAGVGEAGARGVSAAAALLVVLGVYAWAQRREGWEGGLGAALVLTTSAGWFGLARFANLDMALTAAVAGGVLAGLAWLERPPPRRRPLFPYVAAALGTAIKGPLGAVLVAGPLALAILLARPRPRLTELGLGRGLLVAVAIVSTLYGPVGLLDATYLGHFATTNVTRLLPGSRHEAPVVYYLLWLPALFLPWTLCLWPAVVRAAHDPGRRALVYWALFVPACLTLARGKLATYALSALVPLALITGPELARMVRVGPRADEDRALRIGGWLAVAMLGAATAAALAAGRVYPVPVRGRVLLAAVAAGWALALGMTLLRRGSRLVPAGILGAALTLYPLTIRFVAPAVSRLHSDRDAARLILAAQPARIVAFAGLAPSLVFYLRAPVPWTDDPARVRDLFAAEEPVFLVTGRRHFAEIERLLGERAYRWHETRRRRLYANRPPPEVANGSR